MNRRPKRPPLHSRSQVSGGHRAEAPPVPIPNTAVKLRIADDTARATAWESRTPPGYMKAVGLKPNGLFFFPAIPYPFHASLKVPRTECAPTVEGPVENQLPCGRF